MPVALPPKPPAIVAPQPVPIMKDIELISNGRTYHIPVQGIPCAANVLFVSRVVQQPSQRMTVVLSCDGAMSPIEVSDDPTPAPWPAEKTKKR